MDDAHDGFTGTKSVGDRRGAAHDHQRICRATAIQKQFNGRVPARLLDLLLLLVSGYTTDTMVRLALQMNQPSKLIPSIIVSPPSQLHLQVMAQRLWLSEASLL